jgi:hypothetical protein
MFYGLKSGSRSHGGVSWLYFADADAAGTYRRLEASEPKRNVALRRPSGTSVRQKARPDALSSRLSLFSQSLTGM